MATCGTWSGRRQKPNALSKFFKFSCFFGLLMHFLNHQTHHRGQVSTLLAQAKADVGVTDLAMLI